MSRPLDEMVYRLTFYGACECGELGWMKWPFHADVYAPRTAHAYTRLAASISSARLFYVDNGCDEDAAEWVTMIWSGYDDGAYGAVMAGPHDWFRVVTALLDARDDPGRD